MSTRVARWRASIWCVGMTMVGRILGSADLARIGSEPEAANELVWREDERSDQPSTDWVDLDKAWHGVHFLLTGSAYDVTGTLGAAVMGGRPVGEDDGYGPPRLLEQPEVAEVAEALSNLGDAWLRARFETGVHDPT